MIDRRTAPSKNQGIANCRKCTQEDMKVKEEKSLHSDPLHCNLYRVPISNDWNPHHRLEALVASPAAYLSFGTVCPSHQHNNQHNISTLRI